MCDFGLTKYTHQVPDPLLSVLQHLSGYLPHQTGSPFLKGTLGVVVCCPGWEYSVEVKGMFEGMFEKGISESKHKLSRHK